MSGARMGDQIGRGFGSGGSGMGSGPGVGGAGSGTGGLGSGVGPGPGALRRALMPCGLPLNARRGAAGAPRPLRRRVGAPAGEWRASVRRDTQYVPSLGEVQTNTNSMCSQDVQNVRKETQMDAREVRGVDPGTGVRV